MNEINSLLMPLTLFRIAEVIHAKNKPTTDATISGISTDSRTIRPGECFIALRGQAHDGHNYITTAVQAGAVAVIVDHPITTDVPVLVVADTGVAYGLLAAAQRHAFTKPVIAITGSMGKTTVKTLLHAILEQLGPVHATTANYNNTVGVPLTLLGLRSQHTAAVIEIGTNNPGEIACAAAWVQPDIALVTTVAAVHLGQFHDFAALAAEKHALYDALKTQGTAVVNLDNSTTASWLPELRQHHKVITFGRDTKAMVTAENLQTDSANCYTFDCVIGDQRQRITCPLPGSHMIINILAAAAVCHGLAIALHVVATGVAKAIAIKGRMQSKPGVQQAVVIDDTYSGAPDAVRAAIDHLVTQPGKRILVLGDMRELGATHVAIHHDIGEYAKSAGVNYLLTYGTDTAHTAAAFGTNAQHFSSQDELVETLLPMLDATTVCLIKGSRSMRMENIVSQITKATYPNSSERRV